MEKLLASRRSVTAVIVTGIYILLVVGAFAVMFMAKEDESLAGIFVVLVAMPWIVLLSWIIDSLGVDSIVFNSVFSALGCMLNAWIIYSATSFLSKRLRR